MNWLARMIWFDIRQLNTHPKTFDYSTESNFKHFILHSDWSEKNMGLHFYTITYVLIIPSLLVDKACKTVIQRIFKDY